MKANLQSNLMSRDIGATSGMYGNVSNLIFGSWNKTPDYALEYVVERDRVSARPNELPVSAPVTRAAETSASATIVGGPSSTSKIDAILTPRQCEVFELIVQGMSNKEIARALELAEGTVKIHIKALFKKLGVRRRAAVAVAGRRLWSASELGSC
jgi:ATP/maltotriose-dependent transcriptional regulator MalT